MASFKHYLPVATGSEQVLLDELSYEHPRHLSVHARQSKDTCQIFFEVDSQSLAGYVWFLLARLKSQQRRVEDLYRRPATLPVSFQEESGHKPSGEVRESDPPAQTFLECRWPP